MNEDLCDSYGWMQRAGEASVADMAMRLGGWNWEYEGRGGDMQSAYLLP